MDYLQELHPSGDRLYCNSYDRVVALQPGPGESLPPFSDGRTQLAYRMIEDLTNWNPRSDSLFARLLRRIPMFAPPARNQLAPSRTHALLCLLNIHKESIEPLLELLAHQIREIDGKKLAATGRLRFRTASMGLTEPLELLFDIRAYSAIPELIKDLQLTRTPEVRQRIAELLIRLNSDSSKAALYAYAKACTDLESVGGEETLSYLCRICPIRASPESERSNSG